MATNIFLDTEFTQLRQEAELISIGLAADDGAVFYAELTCWDAGAASEWVQANVLPFLSADLSKASEAPDLAAFLCQGDREQVARALRRWLKRFGAAHSVRIWADVLAWDWVLFCELFGGSFGLPEQVHYIPLDLSTLLWAKGIDPDTDRESLGEVTWKDERLKLARHHALYDALLEKDIFAKTVSGI
jgi:hypothetical protein